MASKIYLFRSTHGRGTSPIWAARDSSTIYSNWSKSMTEFDRVKYLKIVLVAAGLVFIFGIYPLSIVWPSGWSWHAGQSMYLQMILGIYATLGVFLILASRDPLA